MNYSKERPPSDLEFEVAFELVGPKREMDAHQYWMNEVHLLADLDVTTELLVPNGIRVICWVNAPSMLDAMIMGVGMFSPIEKKSPVKITSMRVREKR